MSRGIRAAAATLGVAALLSSHAPAQDAAYPTQSIDVTMRRTTGPATSILTMRGLDIDRGVFQVVIQVRPPCRGLYRFKAVAENLEDGRVGPYVATVKVAPISRAARRARCGRELPRSVGTRGGRMVLTHAASGRQLMEAGGQKQADGSFKGTLQVRNQLCPGRYRLTATFLGRKGARRRYAYRFRIINPRVGSPAEGGLKPVTCNRRRSRG